MNKKKEWKIQKNEEKIELWRKKGKWKRMTEL